MLIVVEMCYCHCGSIEYGCMHLCTCIPLQDSFMSAHTNAAAQRALDFSAFLIILSPTKKTKKEVIWAKKLGKGPSKSLDFQCDLYASQL